MTKVIIMEGNGDFAKEIAEQLTREGMEISGVTDDGSVGLEYVRQFSADVVVVGMVLKEIDGFGVLDKLKEIPGKHRTRIYREEKIEKAEHNAGEKEKQPHLPFHDKIMLELEHESKLEPVFVQQKNQYCEHIICKCEEIYLHQRIAPIIPISSSLV